MAQLPRRALLTGAALASPASQLPAPWQALAPNVTQAAIRCLARVGDHLPT